jgi:hypothetical protein
MSNSKTAIAEIKKLMKQFGFMSDESVLKSFKLEDNSILETADLKVGEKITRLNDEFERVALESGKFSLVENFEIEVKDGKITSVKEIFVDAKLVDGTQIKVEGDVLGEGAKVVVVTPDAEIPAPDGVHELEDGTKVETKDGIIVRVEEVMQEYGEGEPMPEGEPKAKVEPMPEGLEEVPVEVSPEIAPLAEPVIAAIVEAITPILEEVKALTDEMKRMKADFAAFKKEPAAKKIANGKTDFNKINNLDDIDSQIEKIMALRKNNI